MERDRGRESEALERLLRVEHPDPAWFSRNFAAQIPIARVEALLVEVRNQQGAFVRAERRNGSLYSVFERGESLTEIRLDLDGRIDFLTFAPFALSSTSLSDAVTKLNIGNVEVSYLLTKADSILGERDPDRPMAVGSAFKLSVLAALQDSIASKRHRWDEVVPLSGRAKSLPTGILQDWPQGTPITLASYATMMISLSDNSAADMLIDVLGRRTVERYSAHNEPFLKTRELFQLKRRGAESLREAYRTADAQSRLRLLEKLDLAPPEQAVDVIAEPGDSDIEWFYSARELCKLIRTVAGLDLTTINPGFGSQGWARHAYKGGSDSGVLNFTSYFVSRSGTAYCFSATWNSRTTVIDEPAASAAYVAVIERLRSEP